MGTVASHSDGATPRSATAIVADSNTQTAMAERRPTSGSVHASGTRSRTYHGLRSGAVNSVSSAAHPSRVGVDASRSALHRRNSITMPHGSAAATTTLAPVASDGPTVAP